MKVRVSLFSLLVSLLAGVLALTTATAASASTDPGKPRDIQQIAAQVFSASNPTAAYEALPESERKVFDQYSAPGKTEAVSKQTLTWSASPQATPNAAAASSCWQVSTTWTIKALGGWPAYQYGQTTHECQSGSTVTSTWVDGQWASPQGIGWSGGDLLHTWAGNFGTEGRGAAQFQFHYITSPWTASGVQNPAPCGQIRLHHSGSTTYWLNSTACGLS